MPSTNVVNMVTASHASTLQLDTTLEAERTVVGAIPTLTIKTEPLEKDAPISEMTHSTAEINTILLNAMPVGYVTQLTENALSESQVKAMPSKLLAPISAVDHHQTPQHGNATLLTIPVLNVIKVTPPASKTEIAPVTTANLQKDQNGNVTEQTQSSQNVTNAIHTTLLLVAKIELLLAKHALLLKINLLATTRP